MKYAYFPGCVALNSCRELDVATREVAKDLGIGLVDLDQAACCGAGNLQDASPEAALAINARTLSMAGSKGLDVLTVCGTCQLYLSRAAQVLEDPEARERTNGILARAGQGPYEGGVRVKHLLQVLLQEVGGRKLAASVRRPLGDLPVGAFYGCHLLRSPGAESFETPEEPTSIERLVGILGGKPVSFDGRTACCGFHVLPARQDLALRMSAAGLGEAQDAGAKVLATPCPLCHLVLDTYQRKASRLAGRPIEIPILHLSQIVGLALGIDPDRLGVKRHLVPVSPVIEELEDGEVVRP